MSSNYVENLKEELAQAERDARPVIVELVSEDREQRTFHNKTTGTVRQDLLGGESQQYYERPAVQVESPLVEKSVPTEVGQEISNTPTERVIELVSGSRRVDLK